MQARSLNRNIGVAFVSFKERRCVAETLEEIDVVKTNLSREKIASKLGIANWQVLEAYAPSDIVWSDLEHIQVEDSLWQEI